MEKKLTRTANALNSLEKWSAIILSPEESKRRNVILKRRRDIAILAAKELKKNLPSGKKRKEVIRIVLHGLTNDASAFCKMLEK